MELLTPTLENVSEEYVLMQAWKKASAYIRYHNWFADTLELDHATANLPQFISSLSEQLRSGQWNSESLRLVPAPKSQRWAMRDDAWRPLSGNQAVKIRPLAHVSLRDQVAATAIMLCLADQVETAQGDPRLPAIQASSEGVVSYGNRLFCDRNGENGSLHHRWGSAKLYRAYFQDYRSFVSRPECIAETIGDPLARTVVIQSDLKQFYDRVSIGLLHEKLRGIVGAAGDPAFSALAERVIRWSWHRHDQVDVREYAKASDIPDMSTVSLPQGLVSAGFFANLVLMDFDRAASSHIGEEIAPGLRLHDMCRYVDDLRLVLTADVVLDVDEIQAATSTWMAALLDQTAPGLQVSSEKTSAAYFRGDNRPLLRQSRRMSRIQTAISGGFDAAGGENIIEAVQALVRAQEQFALSTEAGLKSAFTPVPDVRTETVGRFAASRFRKTFRSLRPLLEAGEFDAQTEGEVTSFEENRFRPSDLTQMDLDDEARVFALSLVEKWKADPSNVRLLRIALDLWPAPELLRQVLNLMRPYTLGKGRGRARKVALYCLSELLRAGATETGFVDDEESLPQSVDIQKYRSILAEEAIRILQLPSTAMPWYLKQQALLFLAVFDPALAPIIKRGQAAETRLYRDLICFLRGDLGSVTAPEFATLAIIARRSVRQSGEAARILPNVDEKRLKQIATRDPAYATELKLLRGAGPGLFSSTLFPPDSASLEQVVLSQGSLNGLRNEVGITTFARAFVKAAAQGTLPTTITPRDVRLKRRRHYEFDIVEEIEFISAQSEPEVTQLYRTPHWLPAERSWRYQLGFLLRFILTASTDFTQLPQYRRRSNNSRLYRPTRSHWYQRIYGLYNGHDAFGDDWLPISQSIQDLLFSMLAWPGCRDGKRRWSASNPSEAFVEFDELVTEALASVGSSTETLFIKVPAPICGPTIEPGRPLRACVVQTVTPQPSEFAVADLTLHGSAIRRRHRNHLSTALAAVEKMLALRETHKSQNRRLDWLILPELAVHPEDVQTHLIPFARAYRTIILAGMVYEQLVPGDPLTNSALWIIPRTTPDYGLQMITRRQGKKHLAPMELSLNSPARVIHGFRPAQWLIGYEWEPNQDPLWLTAAICYDATDLKLASDLRLRSDVFAIPALNRDVGTFDQMSLALHYHMYQMVVIANNGCFGGSNAHIPKKEQFLKQVFHTHGQPQATVSFFEIDDISQMKQRHTLGKLGESTSGSTSTGSWKYPPAGC